MVLVWEINCSAGRGTERSYTRNSWEMSCIATQATSPPGSITDATIGVFTPAGRDSERRIPCCQASASTGWLQSNSDRLRPPGVQRLTNQEADSDGTAEFE